MRKASCYGHELTTASGLGVPVLYPLQPTPTVIGGSGAQTSRPGRGRSSFSYSAGRGTSIQDHDSTHTSSANKYVVRVSAHLSP